MNILPMILALLVTLSLLSSSFLKRHKSLAIEMKTYVSFKEAERNANMRVAEERYRRIRGTQGKPSPTPTEKKEELNKIHREKHPYSTLSIKKLPLGKEAAEKLFIKLYGKQKFFSKKLMRQFLRDDLADKTLLNIIPKNNPEPFLKVLRGTSSYDIETGEGYPPFEEFFSLDVRKPVQFNSAHPLILEAVFGSKKAREIIQAEKTAKGPTPKEIAGSAHNDILDYTKKFPDEEVIRERVDGISIKKSVKLD